MTGTEGKRPISEKKAAALAKAREARAANRAARGGAKTPAELEAIRKMQEGAARKRAERQAVKDGGAAPVVERQEGGPAVEPAPYPTKPAATVVQASEVAPAALAPNVSPDPTPDPAPVKRGGGLGAFLKRGMGL